MVGRKFTCCSLGAVRSPFAAMRLYVELRTEHVKLKSHTHILPILLVFLTSTGPFSTELWELRSWSHNATKVFRCMLILAKSLDMVEGMVYLCGHLATIDPSFVRIVVCASTLSLGT